MDNASALNRACQPFEHFLYNFCHKASSTLAPYPTRLCSVLCSPLRVVACVIGLKINWNLAAQEISLYAWNHPDREKTNSMLCSVYRCCSEGWIMECGRSNACRISSLDGEEDGCVVAHRADCSELFKMLRRSGAHRVGEVSAAVRIDQMTIFDL